jgi:microcystin-dependent protein
MEEKKGCNVINHYYGCCCKGSDNENEINNDSTPVGTVISYMGMKAPKHYLACDGAIYNIDEYKIFSDFIKEEYGAFDFFGGDGTTTFAVPDLRNEFLRGHHGDKEEKLSDEIGVHQNPTQIPSVYPYADGSNTMLSINFENTSTSNHIKNPDKVVGKAGRVYKDLNIAPVATNSTTSNYAYNSRPTNTAVLFCIKYE